MRVLSYKSKGVFIIDLPAMIWIKMVATFEHSVLYIKNKEECGKCENLFIDELLETCTCKLEKCNF